MEAKITEKGGMHFLGLEDKMLDDAFDPNPVWFERFIPQVGAFSEHAADANEGLYALLTNHGDRTSTYMVAVRIEKVNGIPGNMPSGSVFAFVPPSSYLEIRTTPRELGAPAVGKVQNWLETHIDYERDAEGVRFEYYPPACQSGDDEMYVWVPLKRKAKAIR